MSSSGKASKAMDENSVKDGFLGVKAQKPGGGIFKKYCAVRGNYLFIFRDEKAVQPDPRKKNGSRSQHTAGKNDNVLILPLEYADTLVGEDSSLGYSFTVFHADQQKGRYHFSQVLTASTPEERADWMESIMKSKNLLIEQQADTAAEAAREAMNELEALQVQLAAEEEQGQRISDVMEAQMDLASALAEENAILEAQLENMGEQILEQEGPTLLERMHSGMSAQSHSSSGAGSMSTSPGVSLSGGYKGTSAGMISGMLGPSPLGNNNKNSLHVIPSPFEPRLMPPPPPPHMWPPPTATTTVPSRQNLPVQATTATQSPSVPATTQTQASVPSPIAEPVYVYPPVESVSGTVSVIVYDTNLSDDTILGEIIIESSSTFLDMRVQIMEELEIGRSFLMKMNGVEVESSHETIQISNVGCRPTNLVVLTFP